MSAREEAFYSVFHLLLLAICLDFFWIILGVKLSLNGSDDYDWDLFQNLNCFETMVSGVHGTIRPLI